MMACAKACDDCARISEACAAHCGHMLVEGVRSDASDVFLVQGPPPPDQGGRNPTYGTTNGGLLFFGVTDTARKYGGIRFVIQQGTGVDVMGFDDFVVGNVSTSNPVSEPTSLALVALSLLGLGAAARRKSLG